MDNTNKKSTLQIMYETVQEEGGPKGPLSQAVVDAYEGKQTDPVEQKAVVQFKSGIMGIGSPETVDAVGEKISKGVEKVRSIGIDEDDNLSRYLQELKYIGGKLFFGGVDPTATKREFNKLSKEKQNEYIEAIKQRQDSIQSDKQ